MGLYDQWYKNAVFYCLDVETYADSNGDGVGDFPGLTRRLDYLAGLGVTYIWLMPFYPSPGRDDGYDVADYVSVDPRYGSIADFSEFVLEARERGIRVIIDLIPNHTSDQHPWFQAARENPDSKYRDYYVWRDKDPGDTSDQVVFPGEQKGIWTYDEKVEAWYLHHFFEFQPDLNFANPEVQEEFRRIMGFWLALGVSGFRIDAAPFLISLKGLEGGAGSDLQEAHHFLEEMQEVATLRKGNAILLGEVDTGLSEIADYFGGGNQLQALFNFPMNRFTFLGLAQRSADPINFGLGQLPTIPGRGQWVNFLRHHDELNLSRMTKVQREQVFDAFGPESEHQVYNRGLRRRLAPMLDGNLDHLRLAYSLLFSLPGAPMLFYGEEIGMGENLDLEGRTAVRAPMQWTSFGTGGFSTADETDLVRPILSEGEFGYREVSVSRERSDRDSLLNWLAALIRVRKESGEVGSAEWSLVGTGNDAIFAIRFDADDSTVMVVNNLSPDRHTITLDLSEEELTTATDLLTDRRYDPLRETGGRMRINGYGFRWIRYGGIY
ncbi:MAG TPA: alpha-amylase family protein [Thermomicrobiales bacterium]|nr:alpha-amylase family protein [Thermomicrobiales bacterium]